MQRLFYAVFMPLLAVLFLSCAASKYATKDPDSDQMMADIKYLAADRLEGRTYGSKGERKAGDYIAKRFKALGLVPMGDNGTYFQSFSVKGDNPHAMELADKTGEGMLTGRNVIGYLDHGASHTVVIGGHYDHLGYGEFGSLHAGDPAIHNGADDNASGIAMILDLAERLAKYKEHNYLFIAFTGEENGLWGSNYFTKHPTVDLSSVSAMINYDMVGRLTNNKIAINGTGTSPAWPALINDNNVFGLDVIMGESGIGPSDHTSFYLMDIPSIHFFTGAHEDYHKPSDDIEKINKEGMVIIADLSMRIIRAIGNSGQQKMEFTKTKDPDPSTTPKMEVTLGVMPDYLYDGVGLRLDGVREGKPAANAGLMKGDIVIKMGDRDIKDIYVYMEVLGTLHKGDKTKVVVLRGEEEKTFDVQF
jgi:hypothetical protein